MAPEAFSGASQLRVPFPMQAGILWLFTDSNPAILRYEVDPICGQISPLLGWCGGSPRGGPKAAIRSGLGSALGSHPCVALSSYQAPPY